MTPSVHEETRAGTARDVVFVPGLRVPGRSRPDIEVFRLLSRRLSGTDRHLYAPRDGSRRRVIVPYAAARREPPSYGPTATLGSLQAQAERLAEALTTFVRARPTRRPVVVGYSIGGTVSLLCLDELPSDVRERVAGVVTLGAPFKGLDHPTLRNTFGPPMLSRGARVLLAAARRVVPDLDSGDRVRQVVSRHGTPVLNVAVEGDVVAPPETALIGWPDAAPPAVRWCLIGRSGSPLGSWGRIGDLPEALSSVASVHSAVILRRDILQSVAKFVEVDAR